MVLYDRDREDREAIANGIAEKRGATLVRPYDDPFVIAGQGTAGREIAEDMAALGLVPDIVVAPASGGGLIAGVATAVKAKFPQAQIIVAEPKDYDDHGLSLRAGHREAHHAAGRTICDALMAAIPGELTFSINSKLPANGVIASDEEVGAAGAYACRELKRGRPARRRPCRTAGRPHRSEARTSSSCSPAAMSTRTCSLSWSPDHPVSNGTGQSVCSCDPAW